MFKVSFQHRQTGLVTSYNSRSVHSKKTEAKISKIIDESSLFQSLSKESLGKLISKLEQYQKDKKASTLLEAINFLVPASGLTTSIIGAVVGFTLPFVVLPVAAGFTVLLAVFRSLKTDKTMEESQTDMNKVLRESIDSKEPDGIGELKDILEKKPKLVLNYLKEKHRAM